MRTTVYHETNDSILEDVIFHRNVGVVEGNITSESFYFIGNNNSSNLPIWSYDYFVDTTLKLDSGISVRQTILNYLSQKGIDSVMYENINWKIDSKIAEDIELNELLGGPIPDFFDIRFYLAKDLAHYFQNDLLNCQLPQIWTNFKNDSYKRILLFKIE